MLRNSTLDIHSILLYAPSMKNFAKQIINNNSNYLKEGNIEWKKFEDGFPNIFIKNIETLYGRDIIILLSFLDHTEMFSQLSVIYALPRYFVKSLIIVLPYFPTGTMERIDEEGQIATAMTFARLLSSIPITISGPSKLIIYDIHTLQNRFYFGDTIIPLLVSAIPLFLNLLVQNHSNEKVF
jgi:phosphoribosylpyrophosphate synthetase